jgi:hypothetical protein
MSVFLFETQFSIQQRKVRSTIDHRQFCSTIDSFPRPATVLTNTPPSPLDTATQSLSPPRQNLLLHLRK